MHNPTLRQALRHPAVRRPQLPGKGLEPTIRTLPPSRESRQAIGGIQLLSREDTGYSGAH